MKLLAIVIVLMIGTFHETCGYRGKNSAVPTDCRELERWTNKSEKDLISFPHESDCTHFYECQYNKLQEKRCPPNLRYDPFKNKCEWPDQVKCITFPEFSQTLFTKNGRKR